MVGEEKIAKYDLRRSPVGVSQKTLSIADYRRLLDTVRRLNACGTVAALSHDGVAALGELIPTDSFSVQLLRLNGEPVMTVTAPGWPYTRGQVAYYQAHLSQHPILAHYARHGIGRPVRMSDVIASDALERSPIYVHCLKPHGLRYTLATVVGAAPSRRMGISFERRDRDFTRREVALLDALTPHLAGLLTRLELHTGSKRPWREPSTRDWLAGELGVSNREAELLLLLAEGLSNRDIAQMADLAEATVKKHFENAFRKLDVPNRVVAAKRVLARMG